MALISSSPGPEFQPHRSALFLHHEQQRRQQLAVPSSPTLAYRDGEISPTFDASFASSMSITSDPPAAPAQLDDEYDEDNNAQQPTVAWQPCDQFHVPAATVDRDASSSPVMMDCSPAPVTRPPQPRGPSSHLGDRSRFPLLDKLLQSSSSSSSSSSQRTERASRAYSAPASRSPSPAGNLERMARTKRRATDSTRPTLLHHSSLPLSADKPRLTFEQRLLQSKLADAGTHVDQDDDDDEEDGAHVFLGPHNDAPPSPTLTFEPTAPLRIKPASPHTAPTGELMPPPLPQKRLSEPSVPTYQARSSPSEMDVDGLSLRARSSPPSIVAGVTSRDVDNNPFLEEEEEHAPEVGDVSVESSASGASEGLADYFGDDLSPIPHSRKRFLADESHSPTPRTAASPLLASAAAFLYKPNRRSLEKSVTVAVVPGALRRPRSSANLRKRPSSSALGAMPPPPPPPVSTSVAPLMFKRHAPAIDGKPKSMRRAYSVADAVVPGLSAKKAATNVQESETTHRASIATEVGYFGPSPAGNPRTTSMDLGSSCEKMTRLMTLHENGSPVAGFRSQEAKGKALPCFGVKEDGLMRISAATLNDVQAGLYSSQFSRFMIIDCRFAYEYQGGHIEGAINLSELEAVEAALLSDANLPTPCTSESARPEGKTVLIFHCEFSAKRAPTTAKHLRNSDRHRNHAVYPNIHYPEVYILQGGYAEFFKSFPERCAGGYLAMDDPNRLAERSVNLNNFRNQKRQFQRANTFTFGQAQHASIALKAATQAERSRETADSKAPVEPSNARKPFQRRKDGENTDGFDRSFAFPAVKASTRSPGMSAFHEEDTDADCSFGTNGSSPGKGDSPCPTTKIGRHSLKIPMLGGLGRRGLERAQTSSILMFTR
ncbi:m-phase inducer phosphatase [Microbotryomycetes sp. JL201]|nr:m-phase inducer phosphatase [Microbotryomycetes sp. JL201]